MPRAKGMRNASAVRPRSQKQNESGRQEAMTTCATSAKKSGTASKRVATLPRLKCELTPSHRACRIPPPGDESEERRSVSVCQPKSRFSRPLTSHGWRAQKYRKSPAGCPSLSSRKFASPCNRSTRQRTRARRRRAIPAAVMTAPRRRVCFGLYSQEVGKCSV